MYDFLDWNIEKKNWYTVMQCEKKIIVLVWEVMPDVLLPKNYFSANQIATFEWADRHHVSNGCLHLFIANVSKTRERSGAYYSTRGYHEGVLWWKGRWGEGVDLAGNLDTKKERFYSRVIGGARWTCRRDALWLLRRNKRFIMMLQYLGNSFRPLVDGAPVAWSECGGVRSEKGLDCRGSTL